MATTAMALLPFVVIIISAAATVMGLACTLWHIWTPILLEVLLGLLEFLLGFLPLLRGICIPQSITIVVDLGQILAELLAMRTVAALVASATSAVTMAAASWMIVTLSGYVSFDKALVGKAERQTSPILSRSFLLNWKLFVDLKFDVAGGVEENR
jgi:hypothetical protein